MTQRIYGDLENLEPSRNNLTLSEWIGTTSFEAITLQRPMRLHNQFIKFEPNQKQSPTTEIFFRLISGNRSFKTEVRSGVGEAVLKNLENHLNDNHQSTATTQATLAHSLQVPVDFIRQAQGLTHEKNAFAIIEPPLNLVITIPQALMNMVWKEKIVCPCCGQNMAGDHKQWWQANCENLGKAESELIDKILSISLGFIFILALVSPFTTQKHSYSLLDFMRLLEEGKRPIRHWFDEIKSQLNCKTFSELEIVLQRAGICNSTITARRLRSWASGENLMPDSISNEIIQLLPEPSQSKSRKQLLFVRTCEFLLDFICAAHPDPNIEISEAQQLISLRLDNFLSQLNRFVANKVKASALEKK